jgi:hypothetical protein
VNIPKQFVNILGIVAVVVVLVAGIAMIALPMYGAARTTDAETATVAQTNSIYEIQVARLTAEAETIDDTIAHVDDLRREITVIPKRDDIYEIVVEAALETGASLTSVTTSELQPFVPPGAAEQEEAAPVEETPAEETASTEGAASSGAETGATAEVVEAETGDSLQEQVPVAIVVTVSDADEAAEFIDALGSGPRLLAPVDATYGGGTLTVNALAFVRAEG